MHLRYQEHFTNNSGVRSTGKERTLTECGAQCGMHNVLFIRLFIKNGFIFKVFFCVFSAFFSGLLSVSVATAVQLGCLAFCGG